MSENKPVIVMTGGGTGGHITPILALAEEVKRLNPQVTIVYIGERGGKFSELTANHPSIDQSFSVSAGKFRRYHGESWLRRLLDVKTNLLNVRDVFLFMRGIVQSRSVLKKVKPDIIFQKGGFVGVPVSFAASRLKIPIVTHDSDTVPGLANRIVGRWAVLHATAYPTSNYSYPHDKALQVGVLVSSQYKQVTPEIARESKLRLTLNPEEPVLLVTGGSSGSDTINKAFVRGVATLLQNHATLQIIHQVGKGKTAVYGGFSHPRLKIVEFMNPMAMYTAAADIVITRAGANALAELGVQGKACIVVPGKHLTGGHQTKNAALLAEQGAAIVVSEDELYDSQHGLLSAVQHLLIEPKKCQSLAQKLQELTISDASHRLAVALLDCIKKDDTDATQSKA